MREMRGTKANIPTAWLMKNAIIELSSSYDIRIVR